MDNSIICVKEKCCGCRLCEQKCPFNAIEMKESDEGFLYPLVKKELCKNCGICKQNCPIINNSEFNNGQRDTYMVINKNSNEYKKSASGGFATLISRYVINNLKGVVYGVTIDETYNVKHIRVDNEDKLKELQGSKYVQSDLNKVYETIEDDLKKRKVLFIGTPCQVDTIKRFTNNNRNLITCDLVCHGVPSPEYFKKYLLFLGEKLKSPVDEFRFRNKCSYDKCGFIEDITLKNNKHKKIPAECDPFYSDFICGKNYRISCYNCKYKKNSRMGDFTLGDVNSWENYYDFFPEKASSLVIVNNEVARSIFNELKKEMEYKKISLQKEQELNRALRIQEPYLEERKQIYTKYKNFDKYTKQHHKSLSKKQKIKILGKRIIPFSIRIKIKKLKGQKKHE